MINEVFDAYKTAFEYYRDTGTIKDLPNGRITRGEYNFISTGSFFLGFYTDRTFKQFQEQNNSIIYFYTKEKCIELGKRGRPKVVNSDDFEPVTCAMFIDSIPKPSRFLIGTSSMITATIEVEFTDEEIFQQILLGDIEYISYHQEHKEIYRLVQQHFSENKILHSSGDEFISIQLRFGKQLPNWKDILK